MRDTGAGEDTWSIRKKANGRFLAEHYVFSRTDLYLRRGKGVPGIPSWIVYHNPEKKLIISPKFNQNQKALYIQYFESSQKYYISL